MDKALECPFHIYSSGIATPAGSTIILTAALCSNTRLERGGRKGNPWPLTGCFHCAGIRDSGERIGCSHPSPVSVFLSVPAAVCAVELPSVLLVLLGLQSLQFTSVLMTFVMSFGLFLHTNTARKGWGWGWGWVFGVRVHKRGFIMQTINTLHKYMHENHCHCHIYLKQHLPFCAE